MGVLKERIAQYGPAIFMIAAVIGTGSVSSLIVAGAEHGMNLLWALALSCVFFWVLISSITRLTFASGRTFVSLARLHFGRPAAAYIVLAVVISQFSSNIGVLGIVAEAFASWAGVDFLASSIFWSSLIYLLIFFGKYSVFERALTVLVTLLGCSFLVNIFLAHPGGGEVVRGFVPQIPAGGAMIAGAMVGTTLAGSVIVMRSYVVRDKGWTLADLGQADRDAIATGILVFVVSAVIMGCAAATLFVSGQHVDKAIDMAFTLKPLLGGFAATLFVVGIIAAGVSSAFPNALVSIWTISDYFDLPRDPKATHFRLLAIVFCGAGLIAPLFGGRPVFLQLVSLALQVILLPLLVLLILLLVNRDSVVGENRNPILLNILGWITFAFSLYMAVQGFQGLWTAI